MTLLPPTAAQRREAAYAALRRVEAPPDALAGALATLADLAAAVGVASPDDWAHAQARATRVRLDLPALAPVVDALRHARVEGGLASAAAVRLAILDALDALRRHGRQATPTWAQGPDGAAYAVAVDRHGRVTAAAPAVVGLTPSDCLSRYDADVGAGPRRGGLRRGGRPPRARDRGRASGRWPHALRLPVALRPPARPLALAVGPTLTLAPTPPPPPASAPRIAIADWRDRAP